MLRVIRVAPERAAPPTPVTNSSNFPYLFPYTVLTSPEHTAATPYPCGIMKSGGQLAAKLIRFSAPTAPRSGFQPPRSLILQCQPSRGPLLRSVNGNYRRTRTRIAASIQPNRLGFRRRHDRNSLPLRAIEIFVDSFDVGSEPVFERRPRANVNAIFLQIVRCIAAIAVRLQALHCGHRGGLL
jgi:hypothetical protein